MKRFLFVAFTAFLAFFFLTIESEEAEAHSHSSRRCRRLARRVASYRHIRTKYLRRWRRCKWRRGRYSHRCRRLRRTVNRWYGHVSRARHSYRKWGCRFGWSEWSDPWAQRRYQRRKCHRLSRTVASYRRIRASYLRRWRRCKRHRGRYSRRCRHLRRTVNRWYGHVNRARANYRAWGCRFGWSAWSNPWATHRRTRRYRGH